MINEKSDGVSTLLPNRRTLLRGAFATATVGALHGVPATLSGLMAQDAAEWRELAPMPFPVQEIYPSLFMQDGREYVINAGGLRPGAGQPFGISDHTSIFDVAANSWSEGPALPQARHHLALVFHKGALYAISGFARDGDGGWQMQRSLWRLADLDGTWQELADMAKPQSEAVSVSDGNVIRMIGGRTPKGSRNREWTDQTDTSLHQVYSPADNEWFDAAPLPDPRNSSAGVVLGGKVYVISGRTVAGGNNPSVHVYNCAEDSWRALAPLPKPTSQNAPQGQGGLAAAVWGDKIYAFGGEWFSGSSGVYADVWEYAIKEDRWRSVGLMPRPRHGLGAVATTQGIITVGGALQASGRGTSDAMDLFVPSA